MEGPDLARSQLLEKIRRLEETKEGPSLALNLEVGPRIGPNPETVLGPEVARSWLIEKIRRLEETKEGPGLKVGPSLALNLETGPRIGSNPGTGEKLAAIE